MNTKPAIVTSLIVILILVLTACSASPHEDQEVAVPEAAMPVPAEQNEQPEADDAPPERGASTDSWQSYVNPEGFTIAYPPHWQQAVTSDANSPLQQVTLSGPEGMVELSWGAGLGGGCMGEEVQKIAVAQGELNSCYAKNAEGFDIWGQIFASLPNPDVGFGARAETHRAEPAARAIILQIFSTLTFAQAESPPVDTAATGLKTITVRIEPNQAPNAAVVLYAEVPGTAAGARHHFFVEGNGADALTMELPPGEYMFYGYQTAATPVEIDYFGAWASVGGLDVVDINTFDYIILSRPRDPCSPNSQLVWASPDGGRFPPTDSPERLAHIGCTAPQTVADIDPTQWYRLTNLFLGKTRALDTYSDGENAPFMGITGDYSGQFWRFSPMGDGTYRLTNRFLSEGRALDTYSDGENAPFMGRSGNYSGQFWQLTPLGNNTYRLTNQFLGVGRALDTYSDGENTPFMGITGDYSGQFWQLTPLGPIEENQSGGDQTSQPAPTPRVLDVGTVGFVMDGWQAYAHPVGFIISYPPNWQRAETAATQVTLSGPEGVVELSWDRGLGGACPAGLQPMAILNGEVSSCHVVNADGTESWEQIYLKLPNTDLAVRGYTLNAESAAIRTVLRIFATLEHEEGSR